MTAINYSQVATTLFSNPQFLSLLQAKISAAGSFKESLTQSIQTIPAVVEQIYQSIETISRLRIKEAIGDCQYEWTKQNQKIMREIQELKVSLREGERERERDREYERSSCHNRSKQEIERLNTSSHIRLDCLTEQSILAEISPLPEITRIREETNTIKERMCNIVAGSSKTTRPNTNTNRNKVQIQFDEIPEIHSKIFQNVTIKSPLRKRHHAGSELLIDQSQCYIDGRKDSNHYDFQMDSVVHEENKALKRKLREYEMRSHNQYEGKFNNISNTLNRIERDLDEFKRSASSDYNRNPVKDQEKRKGNFASRLHWK